jgi:outer membrane protein
MSAELGATYALSKSWLIGSKLVAGQLKGDAAKSPIVEKKSQNSFGVFTAYRF